MRIIIFPIFKRSFYYQLHYILSSCTSYKKAQRVATEANREMTAFVQIGQDVLRILVIPPSHSPSLAPTFLGFKFSFSLYLTCRNLCERLDPKDTSGENNYKDGRKYCRRCEIFFGSLGKFLSLLWNGSKKVTNWKKAKREAKSEQIIIIIYR